MPFAARADADLDAGGMTFRDFAVADNGTSFSRIDPMIGSGAQPTQSKVLAVDKAARVTMMSDGLIGLNELVSMRSSLP